MINMNQHLSVLILGVTLVTISSPGKAADDFNDAFYDMSGVYDCIGKDEYDGTYNATVTLTRQDPERRYTLDVKVGDVSYAGFALAHGTTMAMYFAQNKPEGDSSDFGVGLTTFLQKSGKWIFVKHYYEPKYKGGSSGMEECRQR